MQLLWQRCFTPTIISCNALHSTATSILAVLMLFQDTYDAQNGACCTDQVPECLLGWRQLQICCMLISLQQQAEAMV